MNKLLPSPPFSQFFKKKPAKKTDKSASQLFESQNVVQSREAKRTAQEIDTSTTAVGEPTTNSDNAKQRSENSDGKGAVVLRGSDAVSSSDEAGEKSMKHGDVEGEVTTNAADGNDAKPVEGEAESELAEASVSDDAKLIKVKGDAESEYSGTNAARNSPDPSSRSDARIAVERGIVGGKVTTNADDNDDDDAKPIEVVDAESEIPKTHVVRDAPDPPSRSEVRIAARIVPDPPEAEEAAVEPRRGKLGTTASHSNADVIQRKWETIRNSLLSYWRQSQQRISGYHSFSGGSDFVTAVAFEESRGYTSDTVCATEGKYDSFIGRSILVGELNDVEVDEATNCDSAAVSKKQLVSPSHGFLRIYRVNLLVWHLKRIEMILDFLEKYPGLFLVGIIFLAGSGLKL